MKSILTSTLSLFAIFAVISCSSNESANKEHDALADKSMLRSAHNNEAAGENMNGGAQTNESTHMGGATVTVAGMSVTAPVEWTSLGSSGMRQGSFVLKAVDGDTDSATVAIFYFGENQGGGISENVKRWLGQMTVPSGDPENSATGSEETYGGLKVHFVELEGTYNASMGGPMMGGPTVAHENYLLSGAIVEAPDGLVFFKLTGPVKTATKMNEQMKEMLSHLQTVG